MNLFVFIQIGRCFSLSPSDGERVGVRGRFMDSADLQFRTRIGAMNLLRSADCPVGRIAGCLTGEVSERFSRSRFMGRLESVETLCDVWLALATPN